MSSPTAVRVVFLLGAIVASPAWGQSRGDGKASDAARNPALADFDVRYSAPPEARSAADRSKAIVEGRRGAIATFLASPEAAGLGIRIVPNQYGLPKTFFREGHALTAPSKAPPEDIARNFLRANRTLFPLTAPEIDGLRLVSKDDSGGAVFLAFYQTLNGIDVFNGQIKFTLSKAGEVIHAGADEVVPELNLSTEPRLSPEEAVSAAFAKTGLAAPALSAVAPAEGKKGFRNPFGNPRGERFSPITAELAIFPMTAASARLAYRIFLEVDSESWYELLIDAENGDLLFRHNLYVQAQGRVWLQSPMDPDGRQLATFPADWMPADNTVTTGNNVDAYLDTDGDDKPDNVNTDVLLNGRAFSATQVFDFPFADGMSGQNPRDYQAAAVTNLFYLINLAHDYYYGLGFNEVAGNYQTDNFGRGGVGNDAVLAEAQNPSAVNNASFAPTVEGTAPKIRMGLFTRGTTDLNDDLDSDYDGEVVLHEYGHGVSNRLVGSKVSVSCLNGAQSGAMGEGWSDYFSISYYNNPIEGAYLAQNPGGIRRQSYEGYTFTYADIGTGNYGYEVHDDGEIWAATLWDLRQTLGQGVTDLLVMNGLKATPCHPSMTDSRDGILAADLATNAGANRASIWTVFARHGLGFSAAGADGNRILGHYYSGLYYNAAFDQPVDLQPGGNPAITSTAPSTPLQLGSQHSYTVTASNPSAGALSYALNSGPSGMTIDDSGTLNWTTDFGPQRVKVTVSDGRGGTVVHGFGLTSDTTLTSGTPIVTSGAFRDAGFANFTVPAGMPVLQVTLRGGSGDENLYVYDPDALLYGSLRPGNTETVSFTTPKSGRWEIVGAGDYAVVGAGGYQPFSGVSLMASLVTPTPLAANTPLTGLSDVLGGESFYKVTVPAGATSLTITTSGGTGDVDLFVRYGTPTICSGSDFVYEPCSYDKASYNDGNEESVSISSPTAGDWFIGLDAFAAYSVVTLTASVAGLQSSQPALGVGTTPLSFQAVGGLNPPAQNLAIANTGGGTLTWTAAVSAGASWLTVNPANGTGNATIQVSATAASLGLGTYSGTITITATGASNSPAVVQVSLTISPATPPAIGSSGGIVGSGFSTPFVTTISPGGFATIFGTLFAPAGTARVVQSDDMVNGNLPTMLAGTCVQLDGKPGFLTYVSPTQINLQVPAISVGTNVDVQVVANCGTSNEMRSPAVAVRTEAASPEFLYWVHNADGKDPVMAVNSLTLANLGSSGLIMGLTFAPAKPGDYLTIYAFSFGPTNPSVAPGSPPSSTATTTNAPGVTMGSVTLNQADVLYAGVSPGIAGLYQLNIRVPANMPDGDQPLTLTLGSFKTPSVGFVTVRAKDPPPTLTLGATALTFQAIPGQDPPAQSLAIVNSGVGAFNWTATAATSGGGNWLRASPSSGSGNGMLQVSVSALSLAAGSYTGNIVIVADGAVNSPATVQVNLTVLAPSPSLAVGASLLAFQASTGQNPAAQTVAISNSGGGSLIWTAAAATTGGGNWLSVSPASGTGNGTLQVSVVAASLAAGNYTGSITITANGAVNSPATVQVTLGVTASANGTTYRITTFAGNGDGSYSGDGGSATSAALGGLIQGTTFDAAGNFYLAVWTADRIRRVSTNGIISLVAGNGDTSGDGGYSGDGGPATAARLYWPFGMAVSSTGIVHIADSYNHCIRRIALDGTITTVAGTGGESGFSGDGGPAVDALLNTPYDVKIDDQGNLIVSDSFNYSIRKITPGGTITTLALVGLIPEDIALDHSGNVFVAGGLFNRILKVTASGVVTIIAGTGLEGSSGDGGPATAATLSYPEGVAVDDAGNIFVADTNNSRVRRITPDGIITTIAGTGVEGFGGDNGPGTSALLNQPEGISVGPDGSLYVADSFNFRIRKLTPGN